MADRIGVTRKWLQTPPKASWVHFDVSLGKKALALKLGAVLTDRYGPVEHTARLLIATGDPEKVKIGEAKQQRVADLRAIEARA